MRVLARAPATALISEASGPHARGEDTRCSQVPRAQVAWLCADVLRGGRGWAARAPSAARRGLQLRTQFEHRPRVTAALGMLGADLLFIICFSGSSGSLSLLCLSVFLYSDNVTFLYMALRVVVNVSK